MKKYRLIKDLLPVGTVIDPKKDFAPKTEDRYVPHYQVLIGIGKGYTATFTIEVGAVKDNPDYFKEVK